MIQKSPAGIAVTIFFMLPPCCKLRLKKKQKRGSIYSTKEACQAPQKPTGRCLSPRSLSPGNSGTNGVTAKIPQHGKDRKQQLTEETRRRRRAESHTSEATRFYTEGPYSGVQPHQTSVVSTISCLDLFNHTAV